LKGSCDFKGLVDRCSRLRTAIILVICLGLSASACGKAPAPEVEPVRLSVEEARTLIREELLEEEPDLDLEITLEERTPDDLWQRMGAQLFLSGGPFAEVRSAETYAVADGQVDRLGIAFGGHGVTSTEIADLNQDGEPELLYTYSWGSGLHRSHVAVYMPRHPDERTIDADLVYLNGDMLLEKVDDQTVFVKAGYGYGDDFVVAATLGPLRLEDQGGQVALVVDLEEELPPEVMRQITLP